MVWKIKGSTERVEKSKSFVPKPKFQKSNNFKRNSFVHPGMVYSQDKPTRLSQKKSYCSFWKTNDFLQEEFDNRFGTYRISIYKPTTLNKQGPKFRWVPKSLSFVFADSHMPKCKIQGGEPTHENGF